MADPRAVRSWRNRREFLQTTAAVAAGAYGLSWLPARAANEIPLEYDGSKFQLKAPEPNPKSGGVLRIGVSMRPPHFDIHQSGTINTLAAMAVMFDNLIRRDPRDGQTIIPDLAQSWEIAKDGKTYTFHLRQGVEFHDGAELTSEDVKATFDRIRKPPRGVSIPRSVLFRAVDEIAAPDKYTVQFKLAEPRPVDFIMGAIASGWNVIVRKKTLEDNNYDLKKVRVYPGTGPFLPGKFVETESWEMTKNKNYWNKGLPYLDGVTFYHALPFSTELGSAVLSGRVDYIRITDPVTWRKAKATPGMSVARYNQSVIQGVWLNAKRKPFDDPRVRRAFHLAFDRPALIEVVKDVTPMQVGGFIYPFSEFATPKAELFQRLGYQSDTTAAVKEAKSLMAAAGFADGLKEPLDFLVR
ncbi:MAG TPA: ABC transporter substrate-binding protein, partial [Stellaceae bacterium]|nr:ABC transporter substrate-binding protein [Stellaceae bacterium]